MQVELKNGKIGELETEIADSAKSLQESAQYREQIVNFENMLKSQDATVGTLSEELEKAQKDLEEAHQKLDAIENENDNLRLKAEGETNFLVLFGEPWLVKTSKYRTTGTLPFDSEESTLMCMGGKTLVLIGGHIKQGQSQEDLLYAGSRNAMNGICICNLETNKWEEIQPEKQKKSQLMGLSSQWKRAGHAATLISNTKMAVLGGKCFTMDEKEGQSIQLLGSVGVFNVDTMKWSELITKGQCGLREGHATCCAREKLYMFGGVSFSLSKGSFKHLYTPGVQSDDVNYHNDLFMLDFETMQWGQPATYGSIPPPRKGVSLCCSDDGRQVWLFGGYNGTSASNEIYVLETENFSWTSIQVSGARSPQARFGHSAVLNSEYLFAIPFLVLFPFLFHEVPCIFRNIWLFLFR